jgi:5-methylcytosine-specific restriction endonuclease McrA
MKFELEPYHRNIPDEDLIADLQRVAAELNKTTVTADEYNEKGQYNASTLKRRFKTTWLNVLIRAGLKKTRNINLTEEQYFNNLEEVWIKLGKQPKLADMVKPVSRYVGNAYEKKFGTWRKALEKFIEYVNNEEVLSETQLPAIHEITNKHKTKRSINWRLRFIVMRRDKFKCKSCGRSPATDGHIILHVDHVVSWDAGGETVLENLQTLCSVCNIGKSNLDFTLEQ